MNSFDQCLQSFLLVCRAKAKQYTSEQGHLELEFRFGLVDSHGPASVDSTSITEARFRQAKEYCTRHADIAASNTFTRVTIFRTRSIDTVVRKVERLANLDEMSSRVGHFERKTTLLRDDSVLRSEYQVRCALCLEKVITGAEAKTLVDASSRPFVRQLCRQRYTFSALGVAVDFTAVHDSDKNLSTKYEVELEVLDTHCLFAATNENFVAVCRQVGMLWCQLHHGSSSVFSRSDYEAMRAFAASSLRSAASSSSAATTSDSLSKVMSRPRNLKLSDIQSNGLVDNPKHSYKVTVKADGQRCFVVALGRNVWITFPVGGGFVARQSQSLQESTQARTMFDAELVQSAESRRLCLVFDTICMTPPTSSGAAATLSIDWARLDRESHNTRLECFERWLEANTKSNMIDGAVVTIRSKPFYQFRTIGDLSEACEAALSDAKDFEQDGLIFMPDNAPYFLSAFTQPLRARSLCNMPDVVKWKPSDRLTVDLKYSRGKLYAHHDVVFEGTSFGRWSGRIVRVNVVTGDYEDYNPETDNLQNVVIEFAVRPRTQPNATEETLYDMALVNVRRDRLNPNSIEVVSDTWNDSIRPIFSQTLLGQDALFQLVRLRQSQNKAAAFRRLAEICAKTEDGCLLDLGSGRGADLSKWTQLCSSGIKNVVALEPNSKNFTELVSRATRSSSDVQAQRILPFKCSIQDLDNLQSFLHRHLLSKDKVTACSMMLVASFLWDPRGTDIAALASLLDRTLSDNAAFLMYTINGHKVRSLLDRQSGNVLRLGPVELSYVQDNRIRVRWDASVDTILSENEQEEWLVYPENLHKALSGFGFSLLETTSLEDCQRTGATRMTCVVNDTRTCLSDAGERYCSMFDFYLYARGKKGNSSAPSVPLHDTRTQLIETPSLTLSDNESDDSTRPCDLVSVCASQVDEVESFGQHNQMDVDVEWNEEQLLPVNGDDTKRLVVLDTTEAQAPLSITSKSNVVRISALSKPSSFWHCLAKAICIDYRCVSASAFRYDFCTRWIEKVTAECSSSKFRFPSSLVSMCGATFAMPSVTDPHVLCAFSDMLRKVLSVRVVFVTVRFKRLSSLPTSPFVSTLRALAPWSYDQVDESAPVVFLARLPTAVTYDPTNGSVVCAPRAVFRFELLAVESQNFQYDGIKPIATHFDKTHDFCRYVFRALPRLDHTGGSAGKTTTGAA